MSRGSCFSELTAYGTMIRAGAIIPSVSALQQRLADRMAEFSRCLTEEHGDTDQSRSLCRLLRYFLDQQLQRHLQHSPCGKVHAACVPQAPADRDLPADISEALQTLLAGSDSILFRDSYRLLCLLSVTGSGNKALTDAFLVAYRKRYFSLPGTEPLPAVTPHDELPESRGQRICLITGPCAGYGFSRHDTTGSPGKTVLRMVVTDPLLLSERLRYLSETYPQVALDCVIPLTGDAYGSDDLLAAAFVRWRHSLISAGKIPAVRCQLVIYARLSRQPPPGEPQGAIWVRTPSTAGTGSFPQLLTQLHQQLQSAAHYGDSDATARACAVKPLSDWLNGDELCSSLSELFTDTPLQLTELLLADICQGFPRHGGWSHWLAEHYLLYPALSQATPSLPLPPPLPVASLAAKSPALPFRRSARWRCAAQGLLLCLPLSAALLLSHSPRPGPPVMPATAVAPLSLPDPGAGWFVPGSSTITGTRYATLAALLPVLRRTPQYPVLIIGYTDNTGTPAGNRTLSLRRAEAVRDWLVINSEFPASHFIVEGAGETHPVTPNDSQQGRAGNRRIEIIPLIPHLFQVNKDYD